MLHSPLLLVAYNAGRLSLSLAHAPLMMEEGGGVAKVETFWVVHEEIVCFSLAHCLWA